MGSYKMMDKEIRELCLEDCVPTSKYNKEYGFQSKLTKSKARTYFGNKRLHATISYRTFTRHLRRGRLGISVAGRRVDDCDYCVCWDKHTHNEIESRFSCAFAKLDSLFPNYWDGFAYELDGKPRTESPGYAVAWLEHVRCHKVSLQSIYFLFDRVTVSE